jgi:hypothetical protein
MEALSPWDCPINSTGKFMKNKFVIKNHIAGQFSVLIKHGIAFVFLFTLFSSQVSAQIERLIVETWYVADANDATDTTQGRALQEGMRTYRIYLDLVPGSKVKKIFGNSNHPLRFTSTTDFYNNIDRPNAYFGYLINKSWFSGNPTLALDSWLTIGLASTNYLGIPKPDDTDGSFIGGTYNNGGSAGIPGGLLVNSDPSAGLPVTVATMTFCCLRTSATVLARSTASF